MKRKFFYVFISFFFLTGVAVYFFLNKIPSTKLFFPQKIIKSEKEADKLFPEAYFSIFNYHQQFLDVYGELIAKKKININQKKVLIIIDSHSDIYLNNFHIEKNKKNDGNWINSLLSRYDDIEEIYWVLPEVTKGEDLKSRFWDSPITMNHGLVFRSGPAKIELFVNEKTGKICFPGSHCSGGRKVIVHKRLLDDSFWSELRNREVILTIDDDFFIYDVKGSFGLDEGELKKPDDFSLTEEKIKEKLQVLMNHLNNYQIKPIFISCARSIDGYIKEEYLPLMDNFCCFLAKNSKTEIDGVFLHQCQVGDFDFK